ncbi:MAG: crosslink repair DNA glycosylase YcaQ family protein [Anaerolineales bacterium]
MAKSVPSKTLTISKEHARRFLLMHHNLLSPRKLRGKQGVLDYLARVGCIQYDPVNVVGSNPDLVLQSRISGYKSALLQDLLYGDRSLIDGWDKLASIYRTSEWPYFARFRTRMQERYAKEMRADGMFKVAVQVKEALQTRGPLSSIEIEHDERLDWHWGVSVRAVRASMDALFAMGELGIHHRVHTRRAFDLIEKLLPSRLLMSKDPNSTDKEYVDWHIARRVGSIGLANPSSSEMWLGIVGRKYTYGVQGGERREALERLVARGEVIQVAIEGLPKQEFYMRRLDLPTLEAAAKPPRGKKGAAFIAPLDNLMWHRNMLEMLFDFHYRWEVYVPAPKRKYGYYVLPVLYGDRFVARLDPAFDKKTRVFTMRNWWWEKGVDKKDEAMLHALRECTAAFRKYLGASDVKLGGAVRRHRVLKEVIRSL